MNCSSKKVDMGKRSAASSEHPCGNTHLETCSAPSFPRGLNFEGALIQKLSMLPSSWEGFCTAQFRVSALGFEAAERAPVSDLWGLTGASSDLRAWVSCPGQVLPVKLLVTSDRCWNQGQAPVERPGKEAPSMDRDTEKKAGNSDRWVVNTMLPSKGSCIHWALLQVGLTNPSV